jgi:hypothetical protein
MPDNPEEMQHIPEEMQRRLARTAAKFMAKYDVEKDDDVTEFMMDVIQIYEDFLTRPIKDGKWLDEV